MDILDFIHRRFPENTGTWTEGNCYWLAFILKEQFGCKIYYLPISGHFIAKDEDDNYYDQHGIVNTDEEKILWDDLKVLDETWYNNIVRDCIN